jgi:hypothetical protein
VNVGIIQGRLSEPTEGFQECPLRWEREFDLLAPLGLSHIEWIITSDNFHNNPLFHNNLTGYPISSICADFMVHKDFSKTSFLNTFLRPACEAALCSKIKHLTIPLLEDSDVNDESTLESFIDSLGVIIEEFPDISFLIEAELHQKKLKKILDIYPSFMVTYDTGNITSCNINHENYINTLESRISQVHLKDRTISPMTTVPPGEGDTDFRFIFSLLKGIKFDGAYTLQTARENNGDEINTIIRHKNFLTSLYNE